jgi:dihydroorotase-like cyclic amidohydrolase
MLGFFYRMGTFQEGSVRFKGTVIEQLGTELEPRSDEQILDALRLTLLPGVIDPQVHFREPGLEHKEDLTTASRACARGGVTSFLEMPNTNPLTITQSALDDNEVLWQALLDGVIDCIATDHAPHTLAEKAQPYPKSPSGMPGVETSLPLMLTQAMQGCCTVAQVSQWMSTAVAKLYQISNKGAIAPGYDADLILIDLETYRPVLKEELQTKCGWSPFEGWNLTG